MRNVVVIASASGNGKTTLGRVLAERLAVPFIELDEPKALSRRNVIRLKSRREVDAFIRDALKPPTQPRLASFRNTGAGERRHS